MSDSIHEKVLNLISQSNGLLRLQAAWVARDFIPPGKRLGLPEEMYHLGARGGICERWLASTTKADNRISVPDEGLSFLQNSDGNRITLKLAIESAPLEILGEEYAATHTGLGRLAKIFDYEERLPYHIHQMQQHARLVGCNSKEEAYYFPEDVSMGKSPDTYFGVHPYIAREKKYDLLLPHLKEWKDDAILQHARAYKQLPNDGFHVPAGTLHAPGSALTIELQEDSDVLAMLQAKVSGIPISKDLLFIDVRKEDRKKFGEAYILELVDWNINGDPYFYENRHTPPLLIQESETRDGDEYWIFYNTRRFSGKKLVVRTGGRIVTREHGVYSLLVWRGKGSIGGLEVEGLNFDHDELLVCHAAAKKGVEIRNSGESDLIIYKFFGPDINPDVPMLEKYPDSGRK